MKFIISKEKYCLKNNISKRTCERWINENKINVMYLRGLAYIVDNEILEQLKLESSELKIFINSIKKNYESLILKASNDKSQTKEVIEYITKNIEYWNKQGFVIAGYSEKSIYRKINDPKKLNRKTRSDKHIRKNSVLQSLTIQNKILDLASYIFLKNAQPNLKITCELVIREAKNNEDLWEIASIPFGTLYRFLNDEFKSLGLKEIHKFANHYPTWKKSLVHAMGSFTDDINFMDYLGADDCKTDIQSVKVYNSLTGEVEDKKIHTWVVYEVLSMKVLSVIVKSEALNEEDVVQGFMEALIKVGKPRKGILIDNGIGKGQRFESFCIKAGIKINLSAPYTPTNKATVERAFGLRKNEFDTFFNNFAGGNYKTEGRHTSDLLSPEKTYVTFEDYKKKLINYYNGFYEERIREKVINSKAAKISIREFFDYKWQSYEPMFIEDKTLRLAYMKDDVFKKFNNKLRFKYKGVTHDFIPNQYLGAAYNDRIYKVVYNPDNLSVVDLYATEDIIDRVSGEIIEKGSYVATLSNIRLKTGIQKRKEVSQLNKSIKKSLKQLSSSILSRAQLEANEIPTAINENTDFIEEKKKATKDLEKIINMTAEEAGENIVKHAYAKQIDEGEKDELAELINTESEENSEITDSDFDELNNIKI